MRRLLWAAALWLGSAGAAFAACPVACTVTNSSTTMTTIPSGIAFLSIDNESSTASIACAFANATATLNTAGSYTLSPGTTRVWSLARLGMIIPGPLNCISSVASSPATIELH